MKIFKKDVGNSCIVCGFETIKFAKSKNYIVYKCRNCGFGYTDNLRGQQGNYHRDEIYIQEEKLFENIFSRRVKEITKFLKAGKVLEIGCSTGLMLSLFNKKGFEVRGIEISKKASEIAIGRGIEVAVLPFERAKFIDKFDLVVLNHTLEHLENPIKVLEKVKRILAPKGYLVIDLPNFGSPVAKVLRGHWPLLLPQEHLWHFTPKAFQILFKKLNFKILKIKKASGIWDFGNPYLEIFSSIKEFKKRFIKNIITAAPSLLMTKLNEGSDLLIIARKK